MKVTFQLGNKELKAAALLTFSKNRYYTTLKIFLSLILSLLVSGLLIISPELFLLVIGVHLMTQSLSIKLILFLLLVFGLLVLIYSLFYYLIFDALTKIMIHVFYLFKSEQLIPTTIFIEKDALVYLNKLHRFMIPWTEITGIADHSEIYLLDVSYLKNALPIVKEPDTLSKEKREYFHRVLQPYVSK